MKKHILNAQTRTLIGRKVKKLRKEGLIPATVYGKKMDSESLTIKKDEFEKIFSEAGETGLIELTVGKVVHPVLINTVQRSAVDKFPLHVEFHKVDLTEKVHAKVPVEIIGTAQIIVDKAGGLLTLLHVVVGVGLPANLPEKIEIDVAGLNTVGDELTVASIKAPTGVVILTDPALGIVRVAALVSKQAEEEAAQEAAAAAEAKVEAAEAAGTPAEATAAAPAEVKAPEAKPAEKQP